METLLISEQFVSQFKYWREGQVRTGMRFRKGLFDYVTKFEHLQRHQAFDLAWRLSMANKEVVVTVSSEQYTVWVGLGVLQDTDQSRQLAPAVFARSIDRPVSEILLQQPALSA